MYGYLLFCLTLIALPIIAVQYPRYMASLQTSHHSTASERTAVRTRCSLGGAGDGAGADEATERSSTASTTQEARRRHSRSLSTPAQGNKRKGKALEGRKPWDPPFRINTDNAERRGSYRILEPMTELVDEEERIGKQEMDTGRLDGLVAESSGKRQEQSPRMMPSDGVPGFKLPSSLTFTREELPKSHPPESHPPERHPPERHPPESHPPESHPPESRSPESHPFNPPRTVLSEAALHECHGFHPSLLQSIVLILLFIIFIFAFAVLVAHCLAWFVVYKTEARLGEARKGLLRGGDMRMCLCARG
jgi:hypothetical protein